MNHNFRVTVQKYGGSSVAEPHKIKAVAQFIQKSLEKNERICVVVSAMGNTTNSLLLLAQSVSADPAKRELDMLLSCGERSSMALLAMALCDLGVSALSLTGSQSGIITDDNHNSAQIIEVKPSRVFEAFLDHRVVIVAGFQGVSTSKEITTLRRGGSDTTAVAMAAALKAEVCEIYSDVAGVMDIDPKIVKHAQMLPTVSFEQMEAMALYGAKILAHDAILLAQKWGVTIRVARTGALFEGSIVKAAAPLHDQRPVVAVTHLRGVIRFKEALSSLNLGREGYFLCGSAKEDSFVGYVSNDLAQELIGKDVDSGFALITLHLAKNHYGFLVLASLHRFLSSHLIECSDVLVGRNEVFIIVADNRVEDALVLIYDHLMQTRAS